SIDGGLAGAAQGVRYPEASSRPAGDRERDPVCQPDRDRVAVPAARLPPVPGGVLLLRPMAETIPYPLYDPPIVRAQLHTPQGVKDRLPAYRVGNGTGWGLLQRLGLDVVDSSHRPLVLPRPGRHLRVRPGLSTGEVRRPRRSRLPPSPRRHLGDPGTGRRTPSMGRRGGRDQDEGDRIPAWLGLPLQEMKRGLAAAPRYGGSTPVGNSPLRRRGHPASTRSRGGCGDLM